jgi:hypothetical protein
MLVAAEPSLSQGAGDLDGYLCITLSLLTLAGDAIFS